jgi:small subunit ribosomal protein S16
MAVTLRLTRGGGKKSPFYRIVAADHPQPARWALHRTDWDYDPLRSPPEIKMNSTRVEHWLSVGAVPSQTVGELIRTLKRSAPADKPE